MYVTRHISYRWLKRMFIDRVRLHLLLVVSLARPTRFIAYDENSFIVHVRHMGNSGFCLL